MGSRIFLCTDGISNVGVGGIHRKDAENFYKKLGTMAKQKGVIISLIAFEDSVSQIDIIKGMVEISGGDIFRVSPKYILDEAIDFLENKIVASEVEIKININKCMTFRDEEKRDMSNEGSTISKEIGIVTKEKENYFEFKFKPTKILSEINEINFDELNNLVFQIEIKYRKMNGGKYIRVISKNLKVSDDKEKINKQADFNIISALQAQKSAKLASKGDMMQAQAQIHIARNYLYQQQAFNPNNPQIYHQFNMNMNSYNNNLSNNNISNINKMNNNDMLATQIHQFVNISQNRQCIMYNRLNQK